MADGPDEHRFGFLLGLAVEGGLVVLAWVLGWLFGQPPLATFRWDGRDAAWGLLGTLPLLAGLLAMTRWPVGPLRGIKDFFEEEVRPLFGRCSVAELALIALLAGLGEEMLFRGVLQPLLGRWLDPWLALVLTSLLFGLLHPVTPAYFVLAAVLGGYLGWLWLATGNLLTVVLVHGLYDFLALLYLLRFRPVNGG